MNNDSFNVDTSLNNYLGYKVYPKLKRRAPLLFVLHLLHPPKKNPHKSLIYKGLNFKRVVPTGSESFRSEPVTLVLFCIKFY